MMIDDPVLLWLDRLDDYWARTDSPPPLGQWIGEIQSTDRTEIVTELVRADLNWRLRQATHGEIVTSDFVTRSLVPLATEFGGQALVQKLIDDEFVYRCQTEFGTTTKNFAATVAAETGVDPTPVQEHLLQLAIRENPLQLKFFLPQSESDQPALKYRLGKTLEIGRANETEPVAPALMAGPHPRLIIAHCREVSVSRQQIFLVRKEWSIVKVQNSSNKVPISIGETRVVPPKQAMSLPVPFMCVIGKIRIRVDPLRR
jgi:hypothetical protein